MPNLAAGTYPAFAAHYIKLVETDTIAETVAKYAWSINSFFAGIAESKVEYRYAEGKWSIKEMLLHITDAERVFAYRALCIARGDKTPLPGFDENIYAPASKADARSWQSLLHEFIAVRKSTDLLLLSFTPEQLAQTGITNDSPNTVEALSFTLYGHILHHINILKERYLQVS